MQSKGKIRIRLFLLTSLALSVVPIILSNFIVFVLTR